LRNTNNPDKNNSNPQSQETKVAVTTVDSEGDTLPARETGCFTQDVTLKDKQNFIQVDNIGTPGDSRKQKQCAQRHHAYRE
jgi:hypothetical protein